MTTTHTRVLKAQHAECVGSKRHTRFVFPIIVNRFITIPGNSRCGIPRMHQIARSNALVLHKIAGGLLRARVSASNCGRDCTRAREPANESQVQSRWHTWRDNRPCAHACGHCVWISICVCGHRIRIGVCVSLNVRNKCDCIHRANNITRD